MTSRPTFISLGIAIAISVVIAGCGGDGDSTSSTSSLTKLQFIKKGDAICEKADKAQLSALAKAGDEATRQGQSKAEQDEVVVKAALPPIQREAEELAELEAPDGDEAEVEAIVDSIEIAIEKAEADPRKMLNGTDTSFEDANKLASEYGFDACSDTL